MPAISLPLLLSAVLPVFLIMTVGALLRRWRVLTPEGDAAILGLAVNVTYPCFIVHSVVGNAALRRPENVWMPILCGAGFMIISGAIAYLSGPLFALRESRARRTFSLACSIQNYGYLPIPILAVLFPDDGWRGVLFVYSLGVELVLWTLGVWLMNPSGHGAARKALNPVVLSIVVGLGLNCLPLATWFPDGNPLPWPIATLTHATGMIGNSAVLLGLLMVGATFSDLLRRPKWLGDWRTLAGGIIMRLAVLPLVMLGLMALLPAATAGGPWFAATPEFRHMVAIQAAMPAAVFPMIIARRYGGEEAVAMRVILASTLFSLVTIPFTVQWALRWLG